MSAEDFAAATALARHQRDQEAQEEAESAGFDSVHEWLEHIAEAAAEAREDQRRDERWTS